MSLSLCSVGANVNAGRGGDSPLHAAVRQDSADQVSVLLDYGADVNIRDSNNQRPVELAPPGGKTQQLLLTFEGNILYCGDSQYGCTELLEVQLYYNCLSL